MTTKVRTVITDRNKTSTSCIFMFNVTFNCHACIDFWACLHVKDDFANHQNCSLFRENVFAVVIEIVEEKKVEIRFVY